MKRSIANNHNLRMAKVPVVAVGLFLLVSIIGGSIILHARNHVSTAGNCTSSSVQSTNVSAVPNCTKELSHHQTQVHDQAPSVVNGDVLGSEIVIVPRQVASTPTPVPQRPRPQPVKISPTPIPSIPSYPTSPGQAGVIAMINQVFGAYAAGALNVARCESGFNPQAYNPVSIGGSHAEGVFQILYPSTWDGTSEAASSPYSAMANILAAHQIFVRDGYSWREWSCAA
jgi:hypothetical protein